MLVFEEECGEKAEPSKKSLFVLDKEIILRGNSAEIRNHYEEFIKELNRFNKSIRDRLSENLRNLYKILAALEASSPKRRRSQPFFVELLRARVCRTLASWQIRQRPQMVVKKAVGFTGLLQVFGRNTP